VPGPPKTCRGTIIIPAAAVAEAPKNSRRVIFNAFFDGFFLVVFMLLSFPAFFFFVFINILLAR
jgi:hypothetical protein